MVVMTTLPESALLLVSAELVLQQVRSSIVLQVLMPNITLLQDVPQWLSKNSPLQAMLFL